MDQEERATFLSPAEDESSREVFSLIKKLNIVPDTKRKARTPCKIYWFHQIAELAKPMQFISNQGFFILRILIVSAVILRCSFLWNVAPWAGKKYIIKGKLVGTGTCETNEGLLIDGTPLCAAKSLNNCLCESIFLDAYLTSISRIYLNNRNVFPSEVLCVISYMWGAISEFFYLVIVSHLLSVGLQIVSCPHLKSTDQARSGHLFLGEMTAIAGLLSQWRRILQIR